MAELSFNEILISSSPAWHTLHRTVTFLSVGVGLLELPSTPRTLRLQTNVFCDDTPGVTIVPSSTSLRCWNSVLTAGNYDALDAGS